MIKKILFNIAAVAAVCFAATSCSSDEDPILNGGGLEAADAEITLAFNDGGESRAARPVNSSEAANDVNEVKISLFVLKGETWEEATDVTLKVGNKILENGVLRWEPNKTPGVPGDNSDGRDVNQTLKVSGLAKGAQYSIVAYGYNNENMQTTITSDKQTFTAEVSGQNPVEEVFAGNATFSSDEDGKVASNVKVTMKRQVAGFLGYFKNIPAEWEGKTVKGVRVVASASASVFTFGANGCLGKQNSTTKVGEVVVYDMAIPEGATNVAGIYHFQQEQPSGVTILPNSLLSGKFLVAFEKQSTATFKVQLMGENNVPLNTWNVKNGNEGQMFDVNRNQFYMIGKKYKNGGTPDPENPDDPIDLSETSEIELCLNDAWDVLNELELD